MSNKAVMFTFSLLTLTFTIWCSPAFAKSRLSNIEILELDTARGTTKATSFSLGFTEGRRPSRISVNNKEFNYQLNISREDQKDKTVIIRIDLKRRKKRRGKQSSVELNLSSRVKIGQRVVIAQVEFGNGKRLDIAVTLN